MRKLLAICTAAAALAIAAGAAAAPGNGNGATVVKDEGCVTTVFATTCTVVKTTTNMTTTPSGNVSYVTNGTVERTMTFVFGGSYTTSNALHVHTIAKQGEIHESSDHYAEVSHYLSGTYELTCTNSYDIHWTNGAAQFGNYELECTTP